MSPLWRDEVGVFLAPRRIVLNRMRRGLRAQCVADTCVAVEDGHFANWTPALAALRSQLAQPAWRDANVRVVVADHWVRYAIVPWTRELSDGAERIVHAGHVLSQVYGDVFDEWTLILSDATPGRAQVASALPTSLIADLQGLVQESASRLLSIEPQLVVAFNTWRRRLPDGGWFVSIDEGSLAAAHLTQHGWDRVHSVRIGNDWAAELRRLRTFGRLASGGSSDLRVFVEAPLWLRKVAGEADDGLEWLEEPRSDASTLDKLLALKELYG